MCGGRSQNAGLDLTPPHPRLLIHLILLGMLLSWGFTLHLRLDMELVAHLKLDNGLY